MNTIHKQTMGLLLCQTANINKDQRGTTCQPTPVGQVDDNSNQVNLQGSRPLNLLNVSVKPSPVNVICRHQNVIKTSSPSCCVC